MKKYLLSLILLSSLSACHNMPLWQYGILDRPPGNKPYSKMFLHGWKDGCKSGVGTSSNHFYRIFNPFTQDWQLLENKEYVKGWEVSYTMCRKYVHAHNRRKWF